MTNNDKQQTEFRVKKVTMHHRQCPTCGGTGKRTTSTGVFNCHECRNGVASFEHQTEVTLWAALTEMGLLKPVASDAIKQK